MNVLTSWFNLLFIDNYNSYLLHWYCLTSESLWLFHWTGHVRENPSFIVWVGHSCVTHAATISNYVNGNQCQHSVHVIIEVANFSKAKVLIKNRYQTRGGLLQLSGFEILWDCPRVESATHLICYLFLNPRLITKRTCTSGHEGPLGRSWSSLISVCSLNLTTEQLQPTTVHDQTKIPPSGLDSHQPLWYCGCWEHPYKPTLQRWGKDNIVSVNTKNLKCAI